jgi:hypothetical protein
MNQKTIVRPKIEIPDLSAFGITDFRGGYNKLGHHERETFWKTLLQMGLEVVSGQGVSGANYHRLLVMLSGAFPEIDIDLSIFDRIIPNDEIIGRAPAARRKKAVPAKAADVRSQSDTQSGPAETAPAVSSQKPKISPEHAVGAKDVGPVDRHVDEAEKGEPGGSQSVNSRSDSSPSPYASFIV